METKVVAARVELAKALSCLNKANLMFTSILNEDGKYRVNQLERRNISQYNKNLTKNLSFIRATMGEANYLKYKGSILSDDKVLQMDSIESSLMKLSPEYLDFFETTLENLVASFEKDDLKEARKLELKLNAFSAIDSLSLETTIEICEFINTKL